MAKYEDINQEEEELETDESSELDERPPKKRGVIRKTGRGIGVLATLPLRLMMPRGTILRTKRLERREVTQVCPACLMADMEYVHKLELWACPHCDFIVEIPDSNIEELKNYVRLHGHEIPRKLDPIKVKNAVGKKVLAARILAFIAWLSFIFNALFLIQGKYLVFIAGLSILFSLLLLVANYGYRAWQLATGNLFPIDGKQQFIDYLSNNIWIKNPLNS